MSTNESKSIIHRFLIRSQIILMLCSLLKGITKSLPYFIGGIFLSSGLNHWLEVPVWGRQTIWVLVFGISSIVLLTGFLPLRIFSVREKSKNMVQNMKGKKGFRPDELALGAELSHQETREGISAELRDLFLIDFAQKLRACSAFSCFPRWPWKKPAVFTLAVLIGCGSVWALFPNQFPLNSHVLFPFGGANLSQYVSVFPGNTTVEWGGSVDIKVGLNVKTFNVPDLYVKTNDSWIRHESIKEVKGTQFFNLKNIVEPVQYRIRWKNEWGQKFIVTPLKPIDLDEFEIKIRQPDYLGGELTQQTSPELTGLPGSDVSIRARANVPLVRAKILFLDGSEIPAQVDKRDTLSGSFSLTKSGAYGFYLESDDGAKSSKNNSYPIHVVEDVSPEIELLSPETDLVVGLDETIPLTFNAKDDYGIRKILLIWKKEGGKTNERNIFKYRERRLNLLETYEWELGDERFKPGDLIQFKLKVADGNVVTGPGVSETDWVYLEIASFEKRHEALEEILETWRDQALDLLADINTTKSEVENSESDLQKMAAEFNKTTRKSETLQKALEKIVQIMEEDPLADYGVWLEHKAMADNLEAMNQNAMKRAQGAMQTKNRKSAAQQLEQISSELERTLALSEELSKTQRARDILESGDSLEELGEDMVSQMEQALDKSKKLTPEQMAEIGKMVNEAQKLLSEIAKSIEKFPDELPEDFINQEALKDLETQETKDMLTQIQEAMAAGDFKKALELAKQFLEMAKKMKEQLSEAHDSYLEENSAQGLSDEMEAQEQRLSEITQKQRDLLAETQNLEAKRLQEMMKAQEELLKELAKRQKEVIENTKTVLDRKYADQKAKLALQNQLKIMMEVEKELTGGRLVNSIKWLEGIVDQLKKIDEMLKKNDLDSQVSSKVAAIQKEEEEIHALLKKPVEPKKAFTEAEKKLFKKLQKQQAALAGETKELKDSLSALSQRTASLGVELAESLQGAESDMGRAALKLGQNDSQSAQAAEEAALQKLQSAQNAMSEARGSMNDRASQQMQSGKGGPGGGKGPKAIMRGSQSGQSGSKTNKVRLPTAEDYKPPKEFREELLESLREKYPALYEDIIHKYFKSLSE